MTDPNQAQDIWLRAAERVKDRVIAPTLYRALEVGVGLTIEDDYLILGFTNADFPMSGHLRSSQHQPIIEQCLSEVAGRKMRLRVVEGTTLQDYENYKTMQAVGEAGRALLSERKELEHQVERAWDEVGEEISRGYARLHLRQLPQTRGLYIAQAFEILKEAVNRLNYSVDSDELHKRALARVFDKFAVAIDVPPAWLAYEFFRLRKEGKLG